MSRALSAHAGAEGDLVALWYRRGPCRSVQRPSAPRRCAACDSPIVSVPPLAAVLSPSNPEVSLVRVPVTDLVGNPGATRALTRAVPVGELGEDPWGPAEGAIRGDIELDLHLDAVVEGILARGRVRVELELPCARCLEPQPVHREVEVAELFIDPAKREEDDDDDPGYELIDDATAIELDTMVRDALLVDLPVRILCDEACQGLCPTCGADRNRTDCGHGPGDAPDPRWAKLAELDLPDE